MKINYNIRRGVLLIAIMIFLVSIVFIFVQKIPLVAQGSTLPQLKEDDCLKCHKKEVSLIQTDGGKHKGVGCLSCHDNHFPNISKEQMIPKCSKCHSGKDHYTLENCLGCHQNPHTPLKISFEGKSLKKECASCHAIPIKDLESFKSKHSALDCNFCHTKHKEIPNCLNCHSPHISEQTFKDCLSCHNPHKPLKVTYDMNTPNKYCMACHEKEGLNLSNTQTKHKTLACVFCHRSEHKTIPDCGACHGSPHPKEMLAKFKGCLDCHNDPHLLMK